ncbi:hypothetical protein SYNPS1DRAFT_22185 [Syncephalis pseudoplumigaleata]|uniref:Retrotransposon gag domain-containing protein n=1 Tax=Syncephalis pseudoplumigaleata TaxID=1712513 RepID=A0A4P9Z0G7_9FUNG|nr:hypothetical protein SYNPS1DRAFT_22185 [Syncephalis pseudoplumigaleata]|eukprot:RKP25953.1 hypothetical protein SYNPS1DRAFT_22185 [Syncephalis pseudoplumigaleata]
MSANSETEGEVPASTDGRATLRYSSTLRWPSVDVDALRGCLPAFAAPPIFRGLDHEDPMDWLEAYERAAHFNRWNNATKLYFVFFYLEETAYAWSQLDQQSRTASWHTGSAEQPGFVDQFCARFCTLGWVEKWGADLNGTFQGPDESVESFCFRVLRLCRRIDPDGEHGDLLQRQAIYRGVDQALAVAVKLQLSQPLDEMIEQLRCAEKIFSRPKRAPSREEDYFIMSY